jgi:hypothetical protein
MADEAEDLAHDIILSALRRGSNLDVETVLRSAHGAARRHGAFLARSAARRRARELSSACEQRANGAADEPYSDQRGADQGAPLSALSPNLQTTLLLLLQGLEKAELRLALGVTDGALRKRFQALRQHGPLARPELASPTRTAALSRLRRSQVALLPRLALALVAAAPARRIVAASDPDGYGLIFAQVLTKVGRPATSSAPATNERTRRKGNPC